MADGKSGTSFYNLNSSYYQDVMSQWNQFVQAVQQVTTASIAIGNDNGPVGLSLLCFTNYEDSLTLGINYAARMKRMGRQHILNYPGSDCKMEKRTPRKNKDKEGGKQKKLVDKECDEAFTSLPPASLSTLTYSQTSMVKAVTDEELSLLGKMILPVFRLDPNGIDPTNITMLSTSNIEPYFKGNTTMDSTGNVNGRVLLEWIQDSAGICVTGTSGYSSSTYAEMMKLLAQRGEAGTLGNIAGALLGAFGQEGLSQVAQLLPF